MKTRQTLPTARDILPTRVYAVRPEMPAAAAALALARQGYSGAPVVDQDARLVGLLSEVDVVRALASAAFHDGPQQTVDSIMSKEVVTIGPDADLFELTTTFAREGVRRLPVVAGPALLGMITRRDLMTALAEVCAERCAAEQDSTLDAIAKLEGIHNPFPHKHRRRGGAD